MTTHTASCAVDSRDAIFATRSGDRVELEPSSRTEVYLDPAAARTFARGILALADEIDGGEVEEDADTRPRVGDRLRVTTDHANFAPVRAGQIITVHAIDYDNADRADYVRAFLNDGDGYAYFISLDNVEHVEGSTPEPLADWERELIESAPKSEPIKVGDRVHVVRAESCNRHEEGRTGIVDEVDADDPHLPYRVVDEAGDFIAWAKEVRRVDGPAQAPAPSTFADLVDEAKRLLDSTPHTAADIITLARDLADRA